MNKAIFLLENIDFTASESKAYVTLLQTGPITGYELSKQSGVARSKIYNILENLRERGAVLVSKQSEPVLYSATPVDELVQNMKVNMNSTLEKISNELSLFKCNDVSDELWYIKGYQNVMNRCRYLIKHAKESVLIQVWNDDVHEILDELIEFDQNHEKCAVVYYDINKEYELPLRHVYAHGFESNMLEENKGARWINIVVDEKELLFGHLNCEKDVEVIWTQHQPMVFLAKENVRHDIYCLKLLDMVDEDTKELLGKDMLKIKDLF